MPADGRTKRRNPEPTATILDSRTVQSTPESGGRAGYDGHKRRKGSKIHAAVDTLGHLLALHVTPANEQDRAQVGVLTKAVQEAANRSSSPTSTPSRRSCWPGCFSSTPPRPTRERVTKVR